MIDISSYRKSEKNTDMDKDKNENQLKFHKK